MKMIITYLAGFISAGALILSFISSKLIFGFAISIPVTILAFVIVHKIHKKKQYEYYHRWSF